MVEEGLKKMSDPLLTVENLKGYYKGTFGIVADIIGNIQDRFTFRARVC